MEAVRIMCQFSETQITHLVHCVSSMLPARASEVSDIDELMLMDSVRMCVDFDVNSRGQLVVLSAELLNRDWDILDTDSFAFNQYLKPVIDEYNRSNKEARQQQKQIRNDQRIFRPC